ncbi:MAG: hypothetical protein CBB71_02775 [Rhodopirellula sp. TMED11]|nr:MAG: hypothetical protein CBB71_02775 [Rhodopirellula sp. TMED11]
MPAARLRKLSLSRLLCAIGWISLTISGNQLHSAEPDEFAKPVRTTEPQTPQQQLASFRVPDGFEVQLVAAEPAIAKPMNLAFDARGNLWVTSSAEYPYPAKLGQGSDRITVLSDLDGDGYREQAVQFADNLNIPIGLYPLGDGAICFSIPNLLHLRDTDGDGKADQREVLYGPFDTSRDTHGMVNGLRRGFDGWLYCCHGFNNQSHVNGGDGNQVHMQSGNTFRVKLDGSRIEHFTNGQVNPFGLCFDPLGNLFSADCHTKPVSLLLRDGYSPSFGKPHDGMGFTPAVMDHLHGSTAIAGIAIYNAPQFPAEYQGNSFGGNVMTSRVNRNRLEFTDGSFKAIAEEDFLSCDDPWFRPVDVKVGPDGALYIADFYNRIIGHYEVPLDHPGRDRTSGRIWRVVYKGHSETKQPKSKQPKTPSTLQDWVAQLGHPNLPQRMAACDVLVDEYKDKAAASVAQLVDTTDNDAAAIGGLWYLQRTGHLAPAQITALLNSPSVLRRTHALRAIAASPSLVHDNVQEWIETGLQDANANVVLAAAGAVQTHSKTVTPQAVLDCLRQHPSADSHVRHALRLGLRRQLEIASLFASVESTQNPIDQANIVSVCLAIKTDSAANHLATHLSLVSQSSDIDLKTVVRTAASHVSQSKLTALIDQAREFCGENQELQAELLTALQQGAKQHGEATMPASWNSWANDVVNTLLDVDPETGKLNPSQADVIGWSHVAGQDDTGPDPWSPTRRRHSSDGAGPHLLISSLPTGETRRGIRRSQPFTLPPQLSFLVAGHDGFPDKPAGNQNLVRLIDQQTQQVIATAAAPRTDTATPVVIQAGENAGKQAFIEVVDADPGTAYAWIAVGQFSLQGLNPQPLHQRRLRAAQLTIDWQLDSPNRHFANLMMQSHRAADRELYARAASVRSHTAITHGVVKCLGIEALSRQTIAEVSQLLPKVIDKQASMTEICKGLGDVTSVVSFENQKAIAKALSADQAGAAVLLTLGQTGKIAALAIADPETNAQWSVVAAAEIKADLQTLAGNAKPRDEAITQFTEKILTLARQSPGTAQAGAAVFKQHCANCHQVAGQGGQVGPNLDGIAGRGWERIAEDVLQPNRNVDVAFRSSTLLLDDGRVITGLIKRREGQQTIVVDSQAKEITIANDQIEVIRQSNLSPMPNNLAATIKPDQWVNLLAYLMSLNK